MALLRLGPAQLAVGIGLLVVGPAMALSATRARS